MPGRLASLFHTAREIYGSIRRGYYPGSPGLWASDHLVAGEYLTTPYRQVSTVYACVTHIRTSVASVRPHITRGDGTERQYEHEFFDLLRVAQPRLPNTQLIDATQLYLETWGVAYWAFTDIFRKEAISTGARAKPQGLSLLDPSRVTVIPGEYGLYENPKGLTYLPRSGRPIELDIDEVAIFRYYDPHASYRVRQWDGLAPLTAARLNYELQHYGSVFQREFYKKGAFPPFTIELPENQGLSDPKARELQEEFTEKYSRGVMTAWQPPVMQRGAKLAPIPINQRDMEWMATVRLTTDHICAVFGVPKSLLTFVEDANRAHTIEDKRNFWTNKVPPKLNNLRDTINTQILDRFWPGDRVEFDLGARLAEAIPEDVRAAVETAQKLVGMGIPPAEALQFLDIRIDVDKYPWLAEGQMAFNVMPADLWAEQEAAEPLVDEPDPEPEPDDDEGDGEKGLPPGDLREHVRARQWAGYGRALDRLEAGYLRSYRGWLRWLGKETAAGLARLGLKAATDDAMPGEPEWRKELNERVRPATVLTIEAGYTSVQRDLGLPPGFDLTDPEAVKVLTERTISVGGAAANVIKGMRGDLAIGLDEGENLNQLTQRVRNYLATYSQGQATVVARTETGAAFNGSRQNGMEAAGVRRLEWLSARDPDVRDSHQSVDGATIAMGDKFANGLRYPQDPNGPAREVVNCRCVAVPRLMES